MLLIPFWGLYTAVTSLPRSSNNPIITVCHTGVDDPHTTCSAGEPDPLGWQPSIAVRVLPQRGPLNGFKYHISPFVGKTKPRTQNQLWNYIIWRYERDVKITLKNLIFPVSPSFFPLFFFLDLCLDRQPVYCSAPLGNPGDVRIWSSGKFEKWKLVRMLLLASYTSMYVSVRSEWRMWLNVINFNWIMCWCIFLKCLPNLNLKTWVKMFPMSSVHFGADSLSFAIKFPRSDFPLPSPLCVISVPF